MPGCAIYLFKTGPLAWNGMFAFWIPLTVFTICIIVTSVMLVKAVDIWRPSAPNTKPSTPGNPAE